MGVGGEKRVKSAERAEKRVLVRAKGSPQGRDLERGLERSSRSQTVSKTRNKSQKRVTLKRQKMSV